MSLNDLAIVPSNEQFHIMAKPSGPACNLDCDYCFYLEKEALFSDRKARRMPPHVLEAYIRNTIASTPIWSPVLFSWQGGEPTLLGLDFYKRAVKLQKKYGDGRVIENTFQTNGTLIDNQWARFFKENNFLIGLSLDGPKDVHDKFRRYRSGAGSHAKVMAGLKQLQDHGVNYNILCCVDRNSSQFPLEIYHFFKQLNVQFIQFTPIVERIAGAATAATGLTLEGPGAVADAKVADFSVRPLDWGKFLASIFDEWIRNDVGSVFVMNFEWSLAAKMKAPGVVCVHQKDCGRALAVEHNGDVYSCDHFVYPEYRLGNLTTKALSQLTDSDRQLAFGQSKSKSLTQQCQQCPYLEMCWGGCPKHRFLSSKDGEPGLHYLCEGYYHYLDHVSDPLERLASLLRSGRDPAEIMA